MHEYERRVDQTIKTNESRRHGTYPLGATAAEAGAAFDSSLIFAGHLKGVRSGKGPIVLVQMKTGTSESLCDDPVRRAWKQSALLITKETRETGSGSEKTGSSDIEDGEAGWDPAKGRS